MKAIGKSTESKVEEHPLVAMLAENGEAIIDSLLNGGLLKDIPILGTVLNFRKAISTFKEKVLYEKIKTFFEIYKSLTNEERVSFWDSYKNKEEDKNNLVEHIFIYIDRLESTKKVALMANAFKAFAKNQISFNDYLDLLIVIESIKIHHIDMIARLLRVKGSYGTNLSEEENKVILLSLEREGLLLREEKMKMKSDEYYGGSPEKYPVQEIKYVTTKLGKEFIIYVIPDIFVEANSDDPNALQSTEHYYSIQKGMKST